MCDWYGEERVEDELVVNDLGPQRLKVLSHIRAKFNITLQQALALTTTRLVAPFISQPFINELRQLGADVAIARYSDREPLCPCAMKYVELVDGVYYLIVTHRSPDGITHTAERLGPPGGPYILKKQ